MTELKIEYDPPDEEKVITKVEMKEDSDQEELGDDPDVDPGGDSECSTIESSEGSADELEADGEWSTISTRRHLPFTAKPQLVVGPAETPLDFFNLLFNTTFITKLADSINLHAKIKRKEFNKEKSRMHRWKDTNPQELLVFLGLLFHMGNIVLPKLNDYWKKDPLFDLCFRKYMGRDRFLVILRCLSFQNPGHTVDTKEFNQHAKPLIEYFNELMKSLNVPAKNLTIKETAVFWHGKPKMQDGEKTQERGNKMFTLADQHGLCQKMHVILYWGSNEREHVNNVVWYLMHDYLDLGYSLYMDNHYNRISLAEELLVWNTYLTGTLHPRRSGNPGLVRKSVEKRKCIAEWNRKGVCVAKYAGKQTQVMISTEHDAEMIDYISQRGLRLKIPRVIQAYNTYKIGVNKEEKMFTYSCYVNAFRWYNQIIVHVTQVMLLNAFKMYNICHPTENMTFYDFRLEIIKKLVLKGNEMLSSSSEPSNSEALTLSTGERVHIPSHLPTKNGKTMRRQCRNCQQKAGVRRSTLYYCQMCLSQPGFCLECFREYHGY